MPAYIATQGPLSHTIADFWQVSVPQQPGDRGLPQTPRPPCLGCPRAVTGWVPCVQMVWEHGCTVIVMLSPLAEDSVKQCDRYWPDEGSSLYHIYEASEGRGLRGAPPPPFYPAWGCAVRGTPPTSPVTPPRVPPNPGR